MGDRAPGATADRVVLRPGRELVEFLDAEGIGTGPVRLDAIGDGHSNLTYLLTRGDTRVVLRRPPAGELSASANDVLREASIVAALQGAVPVPPILATCEDPKPIGAPFYIAGFVEGVTLGAGLPANFEVSRDAPAIARRAVETLAQIHSVDLAGRGLDRVGRPDGYLERQLRRFGRLLAENATRPLPQLEEVGRRLSANVPTSPEATLVHGDFRLGNILFVPGPQVSAVLDWEMATVGDPLADLGYLTATWAEPGDPPNPMSELSAATLDPNFPRGPELAEHYAETTGRSLADLRWYQVLALWKAAIFLEGSHRRYLAGDSSDPYFANLDQGVPILASAADDLSQSLGRRT